MLQTDQRKLLMVLLGCAAILAAAVAHKGGGHYHDTDGDGVDEHDPAHDQEQFLGKQAAKEFAGFDAYISNEKLLQLVKEKVDANEDGLVSEEELVQHLEKVHTDHQGDEMDAQWKELNPKGGALDWAVHARSLQPAFFEAGRTDAAAEVAAEAVEEARKGVSAISVAVPEKVSEDDREFLLEFFKELVRQRKRWLAADLDRDGALSLAEYRSLLFPEDVPAMRDLVVSETIEQLDTDHDGRLSLEEYLAGQWKPKDTAEREPQWLQEERESFGKKDTNGDGFLDRPEVQLWLQPPGGSSLRDEARHLIREADDNRDGRLSLEEVAKHRGLFAGSRATRYGEDVMEVPEGRDEL